MEAELRDTTQSPILEKRGVTDVIDVLTDKMQEAIDLREEEFVNNPELRRALSIVEDFLRNKKRVCYGGMAINSHLPTNLKFYDFSKALPDYDFFTPDPEADIKELVKLFYDSNYTEVESRIGMHEGTWKLFVKYTGVADITFMPYWMYSIVHKRAIKQDGIYYVDADFLRMNMYLELSRPRGEAERWDKVYKRLVLLNMAKHTHTQSCKHKKKETIRIGKPLHELLIHYVAQNQLVFAGAEVKRVYSNPTTVNIGFLLKSQNTVIVYTKNPEFHIPIVRQIVDDESPNSAISIVHWPPINEGYPEMWGIQKNGQLVFIAILESFCHSYNVAHLPSINDTINILSLDGAITLFYMLTFFRGLDGIVPSSLHCFADALVDISRSTRDKGNSGVYPPFVTTCHGHQPFKASLMREKRKRVVSLKRKLKAEKAVRRKTVKRRTRN